MLDVGHYLLLSIGLLLQSYSEQQTELTYWPLTIYIIFCIYWGPQPTFFSSPQPLVLMEVVNKLQWQLYIDEGIKSLRVSKWDRESNAPLLTARHHNPSGCRNWGKNSTQTHLDWSGLVCPIRESSEIHTHPCATVSVVYTDNAVGISIGIVGVNHRYSGVQISIEFLKSFFESRFSVKTIFPVWK